MMSQPLKKLKTSFTLQNGGMNNPLLLFYLQLGLNVTKNTVLMGTLPKIVSNALYRRQWTQEGMVTKIQTPV